MSASTSRSWTTAAGVGEPEEEEEAAALASLLETSRTQEGRYQLAPLVPSILRHLRPGHPLLLPSLRLLRNLCAGEPAAHAAFLDADGPSAVASIVLRDGGPGAPPVPGDIVRVGLQLMGNMAAAGRRGQCGIWEKFFPEGLLEFAWVRDAGSCDALCMVLRSCCCSEGEGSRGRLEELCGVGRGLPILKEVVATACADGYRGDWLKLLLCRVCLEESYFPPLFSMFSTIDFPGSQVDTECRGGTHFNMEQAFLLGLLSEILSEHHLCRGSISSEFALAIFHILREASAVVDFFSRGTSPLPTGSPMIDVLGYSLTILRDVCALDDCSAPASDGLVDLLVSSGLCPFLLALLHDLEPPSIIRRTLPQRANGESPSTYSSKVCPYKGFRRDVVAVIGNCTCGRKHVQDEIRRQNGILLLLQQCVIDEDNPYLREWGMLTVSYLLEGNMENQQQIAELEFQGSIDMPEITSLGLRVDVDKKSSRVKLVNV